MDEKNKPIGFFDSGVGGLSVLKETIRLLPNEDYIFYGDSKNAPIGNKSVEEVKIISFNIIKELLDKDVKAIVVACNTATSAAIEDIRRNYDNLIVVGTEPALKPAVEHTKDGAIVVMATHRTLIEKKFNNLMDSVAKKREVIKMPCPGLVELIESGRRDDDKTLNFLKDKFKDIDLNKVSSIVLGCTHYPFISHQLKKIVGDIPLFDGSVGVSKQLKGQLEKKGILNDKKEIGSIEIINSSGKEDLLKLSYDLLREDY